MAFYKTFKIARTIYGKSCAVECDKTLAVFSEPTAFGRLELCLVQECEKVPSYDIIEVKSGCVLIPECGKLSVSGFHNICKCISFLAADKIIEKSKKSIAVEDLPKWEKTKNNCSF